MPGGHPSQGKDLAALVIDADKDWEVKEIRELKELALSMGRGDIVMQVGGVLIKLSPGDIGDNLMTTGPGHPLSWGLPGAP
jgi:hypothetical protein